MPRTHPPEETFNILVNLGRNILNIQFFLEILEFSSNMKFPNKTLNTQKKSLLKPQMKYRKCC